MKLLTYDSGNGPRAGVVVDGQVVDVATLLGEQGGLRDVRALLKSGSLESSDGTRHGAAYTTEVSAMVQKLTAHQRRALKREAVGWDELSDEDFVRLFSEGQPVKVRIRRPPPKTLTVALDEQTLNRLKRIARHKQVRARHLVAMWIAERLAQERPIQK